MELADAGKRDVRTQFAALCWRQTGAGVQILLVTSRQRRRWILPKGWPMDGATPAEAAETEAWEEAGVVGKTKPVCLGIFSYTKELNPQDKLPCVVAVFPVKVTKIRDSWPEKKDRKRKWFSPAEAAAKVDEPELSAMIAKFDPAAI